MDLQLSQVHAYAPNASAFKNGEQLFTTGKLSAFSKNAEGNFFFAHCKGSGATPYLTSLDFLDSANPVFRCSCPSRQFPCKHNLGLMFALVKKVTFDVAPLPEKLAALRQKAETKRETKIAVTKNALDPAARSTLKKPLKASTAAQKKKVQQQLDGLGIAERLLNDMVSLGLASINAQQRATYANTAAQLTGAYLTGVHTAFNDLFLHMDAGQDDEFYAAIQQINYLHALIQKGKTYLAACLENSESVPETQTALEEQLGHAWKLDELAALGQVQTDVCFIQFCFFVHDDAASRSYIDEGFGVNLSDKQVYKTQTIRPYKAKKHIQKKDSDMFAMHIPAFVVYPGDVNPRVRWETSSSSELTTDLLSQVVAAGQTDFAGLIKRIKNTVKNPLSTKNPVCLVRPQRVVRSGDELVLMDANNEAICLVDIPYFTEEYGLHKSVPVFEFLIPEQLDNLCVALMFHSDLQTNRLVAKPLAIIDPQQLIRLVY